MFLGREIILVDCLSLVEWNKMRNFASEIVKFNNGC